MANKPVIFPVGREDTITTKRICLESKNKMWFLEQYESTVQDALSPSPQSVMQ